MLADPALHQRGAELGGRVHVDAAALVTGRLQRHDLVAEAPVAMADDSAAVDGAVVDADQAGKERIELGRASEEADLDALHVVLVDQHAEGVALAEVPLDVRQHGWPDGQWRGAGGGPDTHELRG